LKKGTKQRVVKWGPGGAERGRKENKWIGTAWEWGSTRGTHTTTKRKKVGNTKRIYYWGASKFKYGCKTMTASKKSPRLDLVGGSFKKRAGIRKTEYGKPEKCGRKPLKLKREQNRLKIHDYRGTERVRPRPKRKQTKNTKEDGK